MLGWKVEVRGGKGDKDRVLTLPKSLRTGSASECEKAAPGLLNGQRQPRLSLSVLDLGSLFRVEDPPRPCDVWA